MADYEEYLMLLGEVFPLAVARPIPTPDWALRAKGSPIYNGDPSSYFIRAPAYEFGIVAPPSMPILAYHRQVFYPNKVTCTEIISSDDFVGWLSYTRERLTELSYQSLQETFRPNSYFPTLLSLTEGMAAYYTLRTIGISTTKIATTVAEQLQDHFEWEKNSQRYECKLSTFNPDLPALTTDTLGVLPSRLFVDPATKSPYKGGRIKCIVHGDTEASVHCVALFPGDKRTSLPGQVGHQEFAWKISNRSAVHACTGSREEMLKEATVSFVRLGLDVFRVWLDIKFDSDVSGISSGERIVPFLDGLLKKE